MKKKSNKIKKVKGWGIINEHGLTWGDIEPINGAFGSGLACPNICTNKKWLQNWYKEEKEKIVPCTITYSLPVTKKKK